MSEVGRVVVSHDAGAGAAAAADDVQWKRAEAARDAAREASAAAARPAPVRKPVPPRKPAPMRKPAPVKRPAPVRTRGAVEGGRAPLPLGVPEGSLILSPAEAAAVDRLIATHPDLQERGSL